MDFGDLDDILNDDMGYIPTAIRKQQTTRSRPVSLSRQNSSKSIGSMKDAKEDQPTPFYNNKSNDNVYGYSKPSPKNNSFSSDRQKQSEPVRRNTLFGLHKQTGNTAQSGNNNQPASFEDFFKNQNASTNQNSNPNSHSLSKPPLPDRKVDKNSSYTQLYSPENIIEDDFNNSSVASRRGRPPLSRKNQNTSNNQSQMFQNMSQNMGTSKGFGFMNQNPVNVRQPTDFPQTNAGVPSFNGGITGNLGKGSHFQTNQAGQKQSNLNNQSIQQLKRVLSSQIDSQKHSFQLIIKQERESHSKQIQSLKNYHKQQVNKKMEIKQFQIQKMKQFYDLQLKVYKERELEIKEYATITRKLQANIQTIQKMEKNIKENQKKDRKEKQDQRDFWIQRKEAEIKDKQQDLKDKLQRLQTDQRYLSAQKQQLTLSIGQQKTRLYQIQIQLRKKQSEAQLKYKKLQSKLIQEYDFKAKQLQKQQQQIRIQQIQLRQNKNVIQVQKLQLINARKLWQNEKKNSLQQIHQQKTKVLQKQIQLASLTGHLQIKQQEIQMNQNEYINKLKLIELERKKIQIEKKSAKGQLYFNSAAMAPLGVKSYGLGTTILNRTNQSALNKQFYSNQDYEKQEFPSQTNYKKSVTQMRDQFLKSLPKF